MTQPQPGEPMVPLRVALRHMSAVGGDLLPHEVERIESAAVPWPAVPAATPNRVNIDRDDLDVVLNRADFIEGTPTAERYHAALARLRAALDTHPTTDKEQPDG